MKWLSFNEILIDCGSRIDNWIILFYMVVKFNEGCDGIWVDCKKIYNFIKKL